MPNPILMRKLRGGGGAPFVPYELPGWDYVHETFTDYPVTSDVDDGIDGSQLIYGIGWSGRAYIVQANFAAAVSEDTTDTGYSDGVSINGLSGGSGWEGSWTVG